MIPRNLFRRAAPALAVACLWAVPVLAADPRLPRATEVRMTLAAEGWIKTHTARVTAVGQITLIKEDRVAARAGITKALDTIAPGADWRLVRFGRQADASGAERWTVQAETRLPQARLDGIADRAKAAGAPGKTWRIAGIDMSPSLAEREASIASLRHEIYAEARKEAAAAAGLWPHRAVEVLGIDFTPQASPAPANRFMALESAAARAPVPVDSGGGSGVGSGGGGAAPIAVEQKIVLQATVVVGPRPEPPVRK